MKRLKIASLCMLALALFVLPLATNAGKDKMDDNIYISSDEVIDSSLYKAGNSIIIEGTINGDVFVAGNIVKITGEVNGSVFAAGNDITISGDIEGSVFVAGSNVNIGGEIGGSIRTAGSSIGIDAVVGKNIIGAGSNVSLESNSSVGWDVLLAGATISTDGVINRNAELYGASISLGGDILGDVKAEIDEGGSLVVLGGSNISGDITYRADKKDQLSVSDSAIISGETNFSEIEKTIKEVKEIEWEKFIFFLSMAKLIGLFGMIIVGLVIISISKTVIKENISTMTKKPLPSIGWGLVIFFITPLLLILLMITLIGIPLALILLPIYFISMYVAKVMAAFVIGNRVMSLVTKKKKLGLIWSLVIGAVILTFIISIPIIGWVVKLFIIWWGLGSLVMVKKELFKKINK